MKMNFKNISLKKKIIISAVIAILAVKFLPTILVLVLAVILFLLLIK